MNGNGDAVKRKVKEWLRHADDDLRLARVAFKLKSAVPYKLVAYHAQQGAEKSLKAYLVYKKIDFPHDPRRSVKEDVSDINYGSRPREVSNSNNVPKVHAKVQKYIQPKWR